MNWTLGFVFPTSGFGLIPSGFLEVLVYNLHNSLLDYSRYLWRSVRILNDKDLLPWTDEVSGDVLDGPWSNDLPPFVYCHMCDLVALHWIWNSKSFGLTNISWFLILRITVNLYLYMLYEPRYLKDILCLEGHVNTSLFLDVSTLLSRVGTLEPYCKWGINLVTWEQFDWVMIILAQWR